MAPGTQWGCPVGFESPFSHPLRVHTHMQFDIEKVSPIEQKLVFSISATTSIANGHRLPPVAGQRSHAWFPPRKGAAKAHQATLRGPRSSRGDQSRHQ